MGWDDGLDVGWDGASFRYEMSSLYKQIEIGY